MLHYVLLSSEMQAVFEDGHNKGFKKPSKCACQDKQNTCGSLLSVSSLGCLVAP